MSKNKLYGRTLILKFMIRHGKEGGGVGAMGNEGKGVGLCGIKGREWGYGE